MFTWLRNLLTKQAERKKQKDEWSKYYANDGTPKNNDLSLDPKNDPWTT